MTKGERRELRERYVLNKVFEDPCITPEMAVMLFNWNTDHPEDKITDSLLKKVKDKAKKRGGDIGKLASRNHASREKELERILGKDFVEEIVKDEMIRGFWRKYVLNSIKGHMTVEDIRECSRKREMTFVGPRINKSEIEKIARKRYPQYDYLSEEAQEDIKREIIEEIEEKVKGKE